MKKKATIATISLILCSMMILFVPVQPAKAHPQFVLSAEYPADNGNGIYYIWAEIDGEVNGTMYFNPCHASYGNAVNPLEVEAGVNITLAVFCWLNSTYAGIASLAEGKNIIRHNVTVTVNNGTVIFSQNNFTYNTGLDTYAPMYFYRYDVILDFVPTAGEIYTVFVTYEVYGE